MHLKYLTPLAASMAMALFVSGCGQHELDCKNPRNQDERQQCAHKASTESRIAPTKNQKNWLELTDPKR